MSLNSEALTAIIGEHSRDHDDMLGGPPREGCTGCAMVAHLEAMEREREADHAALLEYRRVLRNYFGFEKIADLLEKKHAASIQRAQDAKG